MTHTVTPIWQGRHSAREVHCFAVQHAHGFELRIETDDHGIERLVWREEFRDADALLERAHAGRSRLAGHGWAVSEVPNRYAERPAPAIVSTGDGVPLPFTTRRKPHCPSCGGAAMYPAAPPRPLESTVLWLCSMCDGACLQQRWPGMAMLAAGLVLAVGSLFGRFAL